MAYLDENGLEHFWGKIKDHVDSAVAPKADDVDVVHKTGDETVQGVKTIQNTSPAAAAGTTVTSLYVRNPEVDRGVPVDGGTSYTQFLFLDRAGEPETTQAGRLAMFQAVSPKAGGTEEVSMTCYKYSSDPSDARKFADLRVGFDKDRIPYATSPATSDDRTNSTDIVTRGYMEASEWNWQNTKKDALVQFKPAPESDLEPVVDFMFTETPPASGEKGPENPSTINGKYVVNLARGSKNFYFLNNNVDFESNGVTFTFNSDGSVTLNGTCNASQNSFGINHQFSVEPVHSVGKNVVASIWHLGGSYVLGSQTFPFAVQATGVKASDGARTYYWMGDSGTDATSILHLASDPSENRKITATTFVLLRGVTFNNYRVQIQYEISDGIVPTDFTPTVVNYYSINLGDTYYGGSLDVATGVMTVAWAADNVSAFSVVEDLGTNTIGFRFDTTYNHAPRYNNVPDAFCCNRFMNYRIENEEYARF